MGRDLAAVVRGVGGPEREQPCLLRLKIPGSPGWVGVPVWVQNRVFFIPKSSSLGLAPPTPKHTPLPSLKVLGADFVLCFHSPWLKRPVAKWKSQEIPIRTRSLSAGLWQEEIN